MSFRWASTQFSNDFKTTDIRAIACGHLVYNFGFLWDGDDGGAFEALRHFAQLQ